MYWHVSCVPFFIVKKISYQQNLNLKTWYVNYYFFYEIASETGYQFFLMYNIHYNTIKLTFISYKIENQSFPFLKVPFKLIKWFLNIIGDTPEWEKKRFFMWREILFCQFKLMIWRSIILIYLYIYIFSTFTNTYNLKK